MLFRVHTVVASIVSAGLMSASIAVGQVPAPQPTPPPEQPPAEQPTEPAPEAPAAEPASDAPAEGPVVDLPPEAEVESELGLEPVEADADIDEDVDLTRGLQEARFRRADRTSVGGYGELHLNVVVPEADGADTEATIDLHRLIFFFAHNFTDAIRFYTEIEIEHAFIEGGEESGELGIEQAFIDWFLVGEALALRAGVLLVPMGIINQWHEPPVFLSVERPFVDRVIIPTTWREGGAGIFGEPLEGLRYELYLVSGLNALGFSGSSGIRGGRQQVSEASFQAPAITGRVEYEPILGLIGGLSFYWGLAGPNAGLDDIDAPVTGVSADVRARISGLEARAVAAFFAIGDADELRLVTDDMGEQITDVGSATFGTYVEAGYDVLHFMETDHALVPFARLEYYDTTMGEDDAMVDTPSFIDLVFGVSYRPIPQLAFKTNLILRNPEEGDGAVLFDTGFGWMF